MAIQEPCRPLDRTEAEFLLSRHDIMPTQQRIEIALILFAERQHVSAEALMERVNGGESLVSKATVYNTLGLFRHTVSSKR